MTQLEVNSRLATILETAKSDLRQLALDAGRTVLPEAMQDGVVLVELADEAAKAEVDVVHGLVNVNGSVVNTVEMLVQIIKGMLNKPGVAAANAGAKPSPVPPVQSNDHDADDVVHSDFRTGQSQ